MNIHTKTPEQVEFLDTVEKLKAAGLNQSDVSRELHISRSAVAMILQGERSPREATLVLLRQLAARTSESPAGGAELREAGRVAGELAELHRRLDWLAAHDRASFAVVQRVIESVSPRGAVSSTTRAEQGAAAYLKKTAAKVAGKPSPRSRS